MRPKLSVQISCAMRKASLPLAAAAMMFALVSAATAAGRNVNPAMLPAAERASLRAQIDIGKLQWPAPPAVPRIKMISEFFGEKQAPAAPKIEPVKKKLSWRDRLAGVKTEPPSPPVSSRGKRLTSPYGVVSDSKGRIYTVDSAARAIFIFDENGNDVSWYRNGPEYRFQNIIGLAIDDRDRLFVTDADRQSITVIDPKGEVEAVFGFPNLAHPAGAAIDNNHRLVYVADPEQDRVAVFDVDTFKFLRIVGRAHATQANAPGTLSKPTNVAVGPDGSLYVSDTLNSRVQIFDVEGHYVGAFGSVGVGPGSMLRPKGIGVDCDGHIWVADASLNRVQIFDREGHLLAYFGQPGDFPGQFILPAGLFIDSRNRVFVSDQGASRVQVFRYVPNSEAAIMMAMRDQKPAGTPMAITSEK